MSSRRPCNEKLSRERTGSIGDILSLLMFLAIIFVPTACVTVELLKQDPANILPVILLWACVIGGLVVLFTAVSYWSDRKKARLSISTDASTQAPGHARYGVYTPPPAPPRPCRYCDAYLATISPICPRCGRRN